MTELPYGSWPGTVSVDDVLSGATSLQSLATSGDQLFWSESRPTENGRTTVQRSGADGPVDLTPDADVRSRVMEYGGGAWTVDRDDPTLMVISDDRTRQLHVLRDGTSTPLSPADPQLRHGVLQVHGATGVVIAVQ